MAAEVVQGRWIQSFRQDGDLASLSGGTSYIPVVGTRYRCHQTNHHPAEKNGHYIALCLGFGGCLCCVAGAGLQCRSTVAWNQQSIRSICKVQIENPRLFELKIGRVMNLQIYRMAFWPHRGSVKLQANMAIAARAHARGEHCLAAEVGTEVSVS